MIKIFSKVSKGTLLHMIVRESDFNQSRVDLVSPDEFLQCAALHMRKGQTFKPHKHNWKPGPEQCVAQESWVVIKGQVMVHYYDINDKLLKEIIITAGEASFTFQGGHNYTCLEEGTRVFEFKTGPYVDQSIDKTMI